MMILTGREFYAIVIAMVPLYIALFLAYGSVKWWKIFTPVQCSGINRFVAFFAVPFLSFHFISINDPYTMDFRFIAADTLQKVIMLVVLSLWAKFTKTSGSFDWLITLFSLSTLPNTLIMGLPLMGALYGHFTAPLMVQVLVMQCIIWYTLLLVFFEYRNAKILILEQFPESGGDVVSIKVDADVVSLDRQDILETTTEVGGDGKLHVTVSKSNASTRSMEIYSVSSSVIQTPRCSDLNQSDIFSVRGFPGGRLSSFGRAPRLSSYEIDSAPVSSHLDHAAPDMRGSRIFAEGEKKETCVSITKGQRPLYSKPPLQQSRRQSILNHGVRMFHRSSSAPAINYKGGRRYIRESTEQSSRLNQHGAMEIRELVSDQTPIDDISLGGDKERINVGLDSTAEQPPTTGDEGSEKRMPSASVMIRLIVMMVWRKLSRNPNLYASILGLIWSLVSFRWHVEMPKIIANSISLISNAGLGMAMFSLGLFMALQPKIIACGRSNAALAMAVKFLIGPGVMAVATVIVGIRGNLLRIAVVQATLCEGIVPFVFATEYNVHTTILSTAVIFGMLITVPVTLVYYIILKL